MNDHADRFSGCILGLALGDAFGAPHEGGLPERLLWRAIGRTREGHLRWSDDTQMSLDTIESFLEHGVIDQDRLAHLFAANYRWSRGYGPGTVRILKRIQRGIGWREASRSVYRDGSLGNGAAMRSPVIGLVCMGDSDDALNEISRSAAEVTHAHPLGIEGALLIARATAAAAQRKGILEILEFARSGCGSEQFTSRLGIAESWLRSSERVDATKAAHQLGNAAPAHRSCVTALYVALAFASADFNELLRFCANLRGDVDTIGAMAGAIWGAANGLKRLPQDKLDQLEDRPRIESLAIKLGEFVRSRQRKD